MPSGSKITQLTSASAIGAYDIIPFVSGSPTTPVTKYIRTDNLLTNNNVPVIDYSGSSTIVGWSSFTKKVLSYRKIGNMVFVQFRLEGISGSSTTTATLPYAVASGLDLFDLTYAVDNGGTPVVGKLQVTGATLYLYPTLTGTFTGWTSSGTKIVRGKFFYFTT